MPSDILMHVTPVAGVSRPAQMPDRRCQERRLHLKTYASRRQQPMNTESDKDDVHNEDYSNSQAHASLGHAECSHQNKEENMHTSSSEFNELETLLSQVNLPISSTH